MMWITNKEKPSFMFVLLTMLLWHLMADLVRASSPVISMTRASKRPINVVLLVPKNNKYMFSYAHVYPALEIAIQKLELHQRLLPGYYFKVRYNDTKCHEAMGMNLAIQYYFHKHVDVFFGPVCDYVIAPVLRQLTFWNLPMITPGANAWGFVKYRNSMFPMLTRVGPVSHYSLVSFFVSQVQLYSWRKVKVIYDKYGQDSIVTDFCHLSVEVLVNELKSRSSISVGIWKFEDTDDFEKIFLDVIFLHYGAGSERKKRQLLIVGVGAASLMKCKKLSVMMQAIIILRGRNLETNIAGP